MNYQLLKARFGSRAGVTLVELLVVILIVTILAVALLPVFRKYVVEAQYAAEALPLIGHFRTQVGLYQYEHNKLPGTAGVVHTYTVAAGGTGAARSYEAKQGGTTQAGITLNTFAVPTDATTGTEGVFTALDMQSESLIGNRMKPFHFQYVNLGSKGSSYAYAVGIFGDGDGLPQSTGYAVFEANIAGITKTGSSDAGAKVVGIWKNYTGNGVTQKQIVFHPVTGGTAEHCKLNDNLLNITALGSLNTALGLMTGFKFSN